MRPLPLILLFTTVPLLADDESSFNSAPDPSWQRFNPTGAASFPFTGGECRLTCAPPATQQQYLLFGLARAALFAPTVFGDTVASVDLTAWAPTTNRSIDGQFPAVMSRVQSPANLGDVDGYGLSIVDLGNGNGQLQIHRLTNEIPTLISTPAVFPLNPTHDYRLVLISRGNNHTGRIFDLSNPASPVATVTALDSTYAAGRSGISLSTDRVTPVDATFDNFLTWDGSPAPLQITSGTDPGTVDLSCDALRSYGSQLQTTTDLTGVTDVWQPASPTTVSANGGRMHFIFPVMETARFFRNKAL